MDLVKHEGGGRSGMALSVVVAFVGFFLINGVTLAAQTMIIRARPDVSAHAFFASSLLVGFACSALAGWMAAKSPRSRVAIVVLLLLFIVGYASWMFGVGRVNPLYYRALIGPVTVFGVLAGVFRAMGRPVDVRRFCFALVACIAASSQHHLEAQEVGEITQVAHSYLDTLYGLDFEGLVDQLSPEAVFRDPTATALGGPPVVFEGRAAILAGFRAGAADLRSPAFEIEQEFTTGDRVVLSLTYSAELRGESVGASRAWVPVRVPAVTVLTIDRGVVIEHVDYVDYTAMLRQIAEVGVESSLATRRDTMRLQREELADGAIRLRLSVRAAYARGPWRLL